MPANSGYEYDRVPLIDLSQEEFEKEKGKFWEEVGYRMDGNGNRIYDENMVCTL